jgi:hypothetical protein
MSYNKVWEGRQLALRGLHGTWDESFRMLWSFKAELEVTCPESIVEIDCKKNKKDDRVYFCRMFVAIKACIDGFLAGCRPYLGVDSTHLTGKYNGQLAATTAIDGHNWIYPVADTLLLCRKRKEKGSISSSKKASKKSRKYLHLLLPPHSHLLVQGQQQEGWQLLLVVLSVQELQQEQGSADISPGGIARMLIID